MQIIDNLPRELFPTWRRAQLVVDRHARQPTPPASVLRTAGFLRPELAESVTEWFLDDAAPSGPVRRSYEALARETAHLFAIARRDLGVRVRYVDGDSEPYDSAAELCAELRRLGSMTLACDARHPLLGKAFDRLRVVHDVFGHAALGLGFDLQSEYATWLQCRTLFSPAARPAAFCELVGAVTAYITTGERPALRADLPPTELVAACNAGIVD